MANNWVGLNVVSCLPNVSHVCNLVLILLILVMRGSDPEIEICCFQSTNSCLLCRQSDSISIGARMRIKRLKDNKILLGNDATAHYAAGC